MAWQWPCILDCWRFVAIHLPMYGGLFFSFKSRVHSCLDLAWSNNFCSKKMNKRQQQQQQLRQPQIHSKQLKLMKIARQAPYVIFGFETDGNEPEQNPVRSSRAYLLGPTLLSRDTAGWLLGRMRITNGLDICQQRNYTEKKRRNEWRNTRS